MSLSKNVSRFHTVTAGAKATRSESLSLLLLLCAKTKYAGCRKRDPGQPSIRYEQKNIWEVLADILQMQASSLAVPMQTLVGVQAQLKNNLS